MATRLKAVVALEAEVGGLHHEGNPSLAEDGAGINNEYALDLEYEFKFELDLLPVAIACTQIEGARLLISN